MRYTQALILVAILSCSAFSQGKGKIGPRIECADKGWNFGVVNQGTQGQKKIIIKNTGDETLNILDIKVTCGCVHAVMATKEIPPGGQKELVLKLSTYRSYGVIRKHCYIYSNSTAAKRPLVLTIDGEVKADWWPEVKQIQLGRSEAGIEQVRTFKIMTRGKLPLTIDSVTCRNPNVKISYAPESKNKNDLKPSYIVTVRILETLAPGPFSAAIAVRVKHRQTPLQNVMMYGRFGGETKVKPLKVFIGRIFYNKQAHRIVTLTLEEGYTIISAKGSRDSMKTQIRGMPDGVSWEIDLFVTGLESEKSIDGYLEIKTDNPIQPKLKVPVTWVSRPMKK
ncbi:MAG: hypothetical protein ACI97A_001396 [Planctomycetota bacterium]|jgi:hypothetical protein